ncbi:MAG: hypothetical protein IJO16_03730 [Clostridia bacterium]|nr:hypothetical protein [Clostridia bacterium]
MERFIIGLGICSAVMSLISIGYILLSHLLKGVWSARIRYYLWLVILVGFLTPFKPSLGSPVYQVELDAPMTAEPSQPWNNLWFYLTAVWILGMVSLTVFYFIRHFQFRKYLHRAAESADIATINASKSIAAKMGVQQISIIILPGIASPMMTGLRSPLIILPVKEYSKDELRLIIRHELSHFKRLDLIYKAFVLFCRIFHWFNPLMPLIVKHIERECELACDEIIMLGVSKKERKIYCSSIICAVQAKCETSNYPKPVLASDFARESSYLRHRLGMIVSSARKRPLGVFCIVILAAVIFSGTIIAVTYKGASEHESKDAMSSQDSSIPMHTDSESSSTHTTTGEDASSHEGAVITASRSSTARTTHKAIHITTDISAETTSITGNKPTTTTTSPTSSTAGGGLTTTTTRWSPTVTTTTKPSSTTARTTTTTAGNVSGSDATTMPSTSRSGMSASHTTTNTSAPSYSSTTTTTFSTTNAPGKSTTVPGRTTTALASMDARPATNQIGSASEDIGTSCTTVLAGIAVATEKIKSTLSATMTKAALF